MEKRQQSQIRQVKYIEYIENNAFIIRQFPSNQILLLTSVCKKQQMLESIKGSRSMFIRA